MSLSFKWDTTFPKRPNFDARACAANIENRLLKRITREGEILKNAFERTVRTWSNKPVFEVRITKGTNELSVSVSTDSDIYRFVSEGTNVRFATMTKNYKPKTRNRVIGSRRGHPGLAFVNVNRPMPGIKGREFKEEILERRTAPFMKNMMREYTEGLNIYIRKAARKTGRKTL